MASLPGKVPVFWVLLVTLLAAPGGPAKMKLGITVDPVKINSLEAFGTLDQVMDRIIAVEETRDGVQNVQLRQKVAQPADPENGTPSYYTIAYVTTSSRGNKIFCCKYSIANGKLYVLQAQAKVDAFDSDESVRETLNGIVSSFSVSL